jgi:hypothetical protein
MTEVNIDELYNVVGLVNSILFFILINYLAFENEK